MATHTAWFVLLLTVGCGSHHTAVTTSEPAPQHDGSEGAVCQWGDRHAALGREPVQACAAGLQCCYPCGIQGCDSICEAVTMCPKVP